MTFQPQTSVCVNLCLRAFILAHLEMCVCSSITLHLSIKARSLTETWSSLIQLGLLPSKPQGVSCLCLPSSGITGTHSHTKVLCGCLMSHWGPHGYVASHLSQLHFEHILHTSTDFIKIKVLDLLLHISKLEGMSTFVWEMLSVFLSKSNVPILQSSTLLTFLINKSLSFQFQED